MEARAPAPGGWHSTHTVPYDAIYGETAVQASPMSLSSHEQLSGGLCHPRH